MLGRLIPFIVRFEETLTVACAALNASEFPSTLTSAVKGVPAVTVALAGEATIFGAGVATVNDVEQLSFRLELIFP